MNTAPNTCTNQYLLGRIFFLRTSFEIQHVHNSLITSGDTFSLCLYFVFSELYYDRGNHHEFVSLVKDLARPGEMSQSQTFDFEFTHVEKPYESYTGQNVKLRYACEIYIYRMCP